MTYVGAPYNFVSLPKKVVSRYGSLDELPVHNAINSELLSGEIRYTIEPKTDIAIGGLDGNKFYRTADGSLAIPGSTVRGMIREHMQILGLGTIADDIEDSRFMYRDIAKQTDVRKDYEIILGIKVINKRSYCKNVKAGYIRRVNGKFYIYKTNIDVIDKQFGEMNYYILSSRDVFKKVKEVNKTGKTNPFEYLKKNTYDTILQDIGDSYNKENKNGGVHYRRNKKYVPVNMPISYEVKGKKVVAVGVPGKYSLNGYLVMSEYMNEKKAIYIVPGIDETKDAIEVKSEYIDAYKKDFNMKEKTLGRTVSGRSEALIEKVKNFYRLPEEGETKAVFYIDTKDGLFFGFTQYLRLFYSGSIKDGLPKEHKKGESVLDYANSIFGFTGEHSYKGRVSFADARFVGTENLSKAKIILGEPKASDYRDYINGKKSYNGEFELKGYKQYWMRETPTDNVTRIDNKTNENENVKSEFETLKDGSGVFSGTLRFHALNKDELGLLLWCIALNSDSNCNIGKGKPYGYGRIKMIVDKLIVNNLSNMYSLDSFDMNPVSDQTERVKDYIEIYKQYISDIIGKNIDDHSTIKDFFIMKSVEKMPKSDNIMYMSIKEYGDKRRDGIGTPEQVVSGIVPESKKPNKTGNGPKRKSNGDYDSYRKRQAKEEEDNKPTSPFAGIKID